MLEYLSQLHEDIGLKDLAAAMGLPKTTLLRILTTLKSHGMVQQDPLSKNYQLGWALIYMGAAASRVYSLPKTIRPFLEQLSKETGEGASLVQFQRDCAVYVDQVSGNNIIGSGLSIGAQLPIHLSAAGKVLISNMPEKEILSLIGRKPLERRTEKTITDPHEFVKEVERVRNLGYALDDEEGEIGGRCVAAPIRDWNQQIVAAISVTGPTGRVTRERLPQLIECVRAAAREASDALVPGGTGRLDEKAGQKVGAAP